MLEIHVSCVTEISPRDFRVLKSGNAGAVHAQTVPRAKAPKLAVTKPIYQQEFFYSC